MIFSVENYHRKILQKSSQPTNEYLSLSQHHHGTSHRIRKTFVRCNCYNIAGSACFAEINNFFSWNQVVNVIRLVVVWEGRTPRGYLLNLFSISHLILFFSFKRVEKLNNIYHSTLIDRRFFSPHSDGRAKKSIKKTKKVFHSH